MRPPGKDDRAWSDAQSVADLGRLTADWLQGRIHWHPEYGPDDGLDDETSGLIPVLAAVNRAGFLTVESQPGDDSYARGSRWEQRAAVGGFVHDRRLLKTLTREAKRAGLEVITYRPGDRCRGRYPVTRQDGKPVSGFGTYVPPIHLENIWEGIGPGAHRQLAAAHQLTIIEPDWGPSDALWRMLAGAIR